MVKNNNRSAAAKKAARTVRTRRQFVEQFGEDTLRALTTIAKNSLVFGVSARRSLAAYKANLTRGTYDSFVSVGTDGSINRDRLGLSRLA